MGHNDEKVMTSSNGDHEDEKAAVSVADLPRTRQGDAPVNLENLDEGAKIMMEFEGQLDDITPQEYKRILRKIDWHLLPLMAAAYMVQFSDKTSLGNAAILGLKEDNDLTQSRYNLCSSIFYVSYLVFEFPIGTLLQRLPTGRVLTWTVFTWALLILAHLGSNSFPGLLVLRFMLGITEGVVTPGFLLLSSAYYKVDEQAVRVGMWFLMNGLAIIFNALVAYGVQYSQIGDWRPWRTFFLILGLMTFALFVVYFFLFPDTPATAWFLSPKERAIALKRVATNQSGTKNKHFKKEQLIEALTDWKLYAFCFYSIFANIPNGLTQQRSIIIKQLGFDSLQTALLNIPTGVLEIASIPCATILASKWKGHRADVMMLWTLPSLIGASMLIGLSQEHKIARLVGVYLAPLNTAAFVISLSWCSSACAGTTKRTVSNAANLIAYCIGNLAGPYIWQARYAPQNIVPWSICLAAYFLCIPTAYALSIGMRRENARRDALDGVSGSGPGDAHEVEVKVGSSGGDGEDNDNERRRVDTAFLDLTDKQNLNFRYPV
ncbi:unnamed protein product [Jaminaea pallidilutea]